MLGANDALKRALAALLYGACLLVLHGCGDCTDMACSDDIVVAIYSSSGELLDTFSGRVELGSDAFDVRCEQGAIPSGAAAGPYRCEAQGLRLTRADRAFEVTIEAGAERYTGRVAPQITATDRPNGESCDPVCYAGTARVDLVATE